MNLEKQTNNKNNLNYFIDFLKTQADLQDKIKNNPDETPEAMWDYIFCKVKEEVEGNSYCDDGTLVLKYTKEYLDDYDRIKANQKVKPINPLESKPKEEVEKAVKQEKTPKKANKGETAKLKQMSIFDF